MNMRVETGCVETGYAENGLRELLARAAADSAIAHAPFEPVAEEVALSLWDALASGCLELTAQTERADRRFLLARNPITNGRVSPALSVREQIAARLAVQGHSTKYIAFEIDVAVSTASTLVASAIKKLGLRSRVELTELFGLDPSVLQRALRAFNVQLQGDEYVLFDLPLRRLRPPSGLTEAEREVVLGVLNVQSNADIARARRTSIHTVANQLRAVYLKLGISGRSQLISSC